MSLFRGIFLGVLLLVGLNANAAVYCSQLHRSSVILNFEIALTPVEAQVISANMKRFSNWLGEKMTLESISRISFDAKIDGAYFKFKDREITISPKLATQFRSQGFKGFTAFLMHEYTHAHLEKYLTSKVPDYKELQSKGEGLPTSGKKFMILRGIHELIADAIPAFALKNPDLVTETINESDFVSRKYSRDTFAKIVSSRSFENNPFSDTYRWQMQMHDMETIFREWEPYMMFSFVRPKIWQKATQIANQQGAPEAQNYFKEVARRLVSETLSGRLNNPAISLESFATTVEKIISEIETHL